jgi:hypothetical protein
LQIERGHGPGDADHSIEYGLNETHHNIQGLEGKDHNTQRGPGSASERLENCANSYLQLGMSFWAKGPGRGAVKDKTTGFEENWYWKILQTKYAFTQIILNILQLKARPVPKPDRDTPPVSQEADIKGLR